MRVLGIDPGLERTGFGLVEKRENRGLMLLDAGMIKGKRGLLLSERLGNIYNGISDIISRHRPDISVLEGLYSHYKHPATSVLMGHARGVIYLACAQANLEVVDYSPTRVKKAVTGNGHASKEQVGRTIEHILKMDYKAGASDLTDALALAVAYIYIER